VAIKIILIMKNKRILKVLLGIVITKIFFLLFEQGIKGLSLKLSYHIFFESLIISTILVVIIDSFKKHTQNN
jgi:hypothetical protein